YTAFQFNINTFSRFHFQIITNPIFFAFYFFFFLRFILFGILHILIHGVYVWL
ncbi:unnamed protein product, partial [Arabidopsis halleri]